MTPLTETRDVAENDILLIGGDYFRIAEIAEPSHPVYPGLTFWGFWWNNKDECWGPRRSVSAPYARQWDVLSDDDVQSCFPTLP